MASEVFPKKDIEIKQRAALEGEIKHSCLKLDKIKKELNFEPKINLKKGLELTYKWFQNKK